jgi:hypothetical protein
MGKITLPAPTLRESQQILETYRDLQRIFNATAT